MLGIFYFWIGSFYLDVIFYVFVDLGVFSVEYFCDLLVVGWYWIRFEGLFVKYCIMIVGV